MISIVAPNFNDARFLPYFLESLEKQTVKPLEVIIVDGYSTDQSLKIIGKHRKSLNIKLIICSKRNFGFIRNLGHRLSEGSIVLQCNSDNYFPPNFLAKLTALYAGPHVAITGRVHPAGTSWIAMLAYPAFDLVRWFSTKVGKYRPSGSFCSYRRYVWDMVGGFPEVTVNEDGLFGQRINELGCPVCFRLDLYVGHWVKKFEEMGGIKALLFYLYVFENHFPMLKPLLEPIERKAGRVFSHQR